jgi:hypothetical protein
MATVLKFLHDLTIQISSINLLTLIVLLPGSLRLICPKALMMAITFLPLHYKKYYFLQQLFLLKVVTSRWQNYL